MGMTKTPKALPEPAITKAITKAMVTMSHP
jgi:hypothetical protein